MHTHCFYSTPEEAISWAIFTPKNKILWGENACPKFSPSVADWLVAHPTAIVLITWLGKIFYIKDDIFFRLHLF